MKNIKRFCAIISIFSLLLLAACGQTKEDTTTTGKENQEDTSYTVEHAMGTTTLKKHLKRL